MASQLSRNRPAGTVRVAIAQTAPELGANQKNLDQVVEWLGEAAAEDARLVVFPECALSGYLLDDLNELERFAEPVPGPAIRRLASACARQQVYTVVGLLERGAEAIYNSAVLVGPDGLIERVAPPSTIPEVLTRARALENRVHLAVANRAGEERGSRFLGRSQLVDVFGTVVAEAGSEEALLYAGLDLALARQKDFVYTPGHFETHWFADRRTDLYGPLVDPDLWPQTSRRAREAAPAVLR